MSEPKQEKKILRPDSIDSAIMEVDIEEWDTRIRARGEFIEELRAEARRRAEQLPNPPKANGEPGGP
jgi:hypothetical protein